MSFKHIAPRAREESLTTASTLWLNSALGICRVYILAIVTVTLALIVLIPFGLLETAVFNGRKSKEQPQQSGE